MKIIQISNFTRKVSEELFILNLWSREEVHMHVIRFSEITPVGLYEKNTRKKNSSYGYDLRISCPPTGNCV